jgi:hypothetical protein
VIRGIFNVFSWGMDGLACKLAQRGYRVDVAPPELALLAAHTIERECGDDPTGGPLVLIGHSLGGRFCCTIPWKWRDRGMRVQLAVILDSNPLTAVCDNVERCVNLYVTNDLGVFHGQDVWAVDPRTDVVNLDMTKVSRPPGVPPVDHFNIDDSTWIHQLVIEEVDRAMGASGGGAALPAEQASSQSDAVPRNLRVWRPPGDQSARSPASTVSARAYREPLANQPARR